MRYATFVYVSEYLFPFVLLLYVEVFASCLVFQEMVDKGVVQTHQAYD